MGLTGGFADVGGLYDCLYGIFSGQADDSILDEYSNIRRQKYQEVIDPVSSGNLRRLWDTEAIENDEFIAMIRRAETDKPFARQMQEVSGVCPAIKSLSILMASNKGVKAVMYDFTQLYTKPRTAGE